MSSQEYLPTYGEQPFDDQLQSKDRNLTTRTLFADEAAQLMCRKSELCAMAAPAVLKSASDQTDSSMSTAGAEASAVLNMVRSNSAFELALSNVDRSKDNSSGNAEVRSPQRTLADLIASIDTQLATATIDIRYGGVQSRDIYDHLRHEQTRAHRHKPLDVTEPAASGKDKLHATAHSAGSERAAETTLSMARASVGRVLWGDFASVVRGGRLGCAASVSEILQESGIKGIRSAGVSDLVSQARKHGYERLPISQARPGDIVYGTEPGGGGGGGTSHVGIVGEHGKVYHNKSSTGRWTEDRLSRVFSSRRFGSNLWVLRAPGR